MACEQDEGSEPKTQRPGRMRAALRRRRARRGLTETNSLKSDLLEMLEWFVLFGFLDD